MWFVTVLGGYGMARILEEALMCLTMEHVGNVYSLCFLLLVILC